jgi:hypothetical protein
VHHDQHGAAPLGDTQQPGLRRSSAAALQLHGRLSLRGGAANARGTGCVPTTATGRGRHQPVSPQTLYGREDISATRPHSTARCRGRGIGIRTEECDQLTGLVVVHRPDSRSEPLRAPSSDSASSSDRRARFPAAPARQTRRLRPSRARTRTLTGRRETRDRGSARPTRRREASARRRQPIR